MNRTTKTIDSLTTGHLRLNYLNPKDCLILFLYHNERGLNRLLQAKRQDCAVD